MLIETFLGGLVVIRRDGKNTGDTELVEIGNRFDDMGRDRTPPGARDNGDASARLFDA